MRELHGDLQIAFGEGNEGIQIEVLNGLSTLSSALVTKVEARLETEAVRVADLRGLVQALIHEEINVVHRHRGAQCEARIAALEGKTGVRGQKIRYGHRGSPGVLEACVADVTENRDWTRQVE